MRITVLILFLCICGFAEATPPSYAWVKNIGGADYDLKHPVAVDKDGNVYMTGSFSSAFINIAGNVLMNDNVGFSHYFIAKFDSDGNILWLKGGLSGEIGTASDIKIDKDGNVVVCGSFLLRYFTVGSITLENWNKTPDKNQLFLVKYDSNGNVLWARTTKKDDFYGDNIIIGIAIDESSNIYATGYYNKTTSFDQFTLSGSFSGNKDNFVVKYNSDGNVIWANKINGSGTSGYNVIVADKIGNVYVGGDFSYSKMIVENDTLYNKATYQVGSDIFLLKYNVNGKLIRATSYGSYWYDGLCTMSVDNANNIYLGGSFGKDSIVLGSKVYYNDNVSFSGKSFILKQDTNGNILWSKTCSGNKDINTIYSMCVDSKDNVYVAGFFIGNSIAFDNVQMTTPYNNNNIYILKYDSSGSLLWTKNAIGSGNESSYSIATDYLENVYGDGIYSGPLNIFDGITLSRSTNRANDFLLYKIGTAIKDYKFTKFFCPNETNFTLTVQPNNTSPYSWTDKNGIVKGTLQTLIIPNPVDSATYICKYKNISGTNITETFLLLRSVQKADFTSSLLDCKTNTVQFKNLSVGNLSSQSYRWDFGDNTNSTDKEPQHKYLNSGEHRVKLRISNITTGCVDSVYKTIIYYPKPTIKIVGDSTLCLGAPVTLKATGAATYKWSLGSNDSIVTLNKAQKVWVIGTSLSGCTSDTTFMQVKDITPHIAISGNNTYCAGNSTRLKVYGATTYKWSNGSTSDTISVNTNTTVWVLGYTNNCHSDTLKYQVHQEPDIELKVDGNPFFCTGNKTTVTAVGAETYKWNTGETSREISIGKAGTYTLTGINKRGCSKTISVQVTEIALPNVLFSVSPLSVDIRHNTVRCKVMPEDGVSYKWQMGDGLTEAGIEVEHTYDISSTLYEYKIVLTATNLNGCVSSTSKTVDIGLFIPNIFTPNGDGINDVFMPGYQLEILSRNGSSLYKGKTGWDGTYQGKLMPDDAYYYVISYLDKSGQNKLYKGYVILKK